MVVRQCRIDERLVSLGILRTSLLLGDKARSITGTVLTVDAGSTA
jgi:hypothetical protein